MLDGIEESIYIIFSEKGRRTEGLIYQGILYPKKIYLLC